MRGLNFNVTADTSNFNRRLLEVENRLGRFTSDVESQGTEIDAMFQKIAKSAAALGAAFSVKDFMAKAAQVRGEFQKLEVAFNTMLGSEQKASALMAQLVETAAITPFGLTDVSDGAKQLLAYGLASEKVNDTLIRLGDIAAGLSIPLNDLTYLYGTTMVQGRMYTQDLNQFLGRGIPLTAELAKQFGVADKEVKELVTDGKIGFPEVEKAIISLTSEGGKFGGLMKEQSKTITGQIGNIKDAIETMFNEIGKSSEGIINAGLAITSELVENWKKVGEAVGVAVTAYGTYKAVIMVTTAIQKYELALTTQIALEKKLAAAANIALSEAEANAAAKTKLLTLAQQGLAKSLKAVAAATVLNPYVLLSAAVTGLAYTIYKLVTADSAEERATKRLREEIDKLNDSIDERKNKAESLIQVIKDETETDLRKAQAYQSLKNQFPEILKGYSMEKIALLDVAKAQKELNEQRDKEYYGGLRKNRDNALKDIEKYRRIIDNSSKQITLGGNGMAIAYYSRKLKEAQEKYNKYSEELTKVESAKLKVETEPVSKETYKDAYKAAEADWKAKTKAVEDAKNKSKEEYLNAVKEAEEAEKKYKALGGETNATKIYKAVKEQDEYKRLVSEQAKEQKRLQEDLQAQVEEARLEAMKDGSEKTVKQIDLDYAKEKQAIIRGREDLLQQRIDDARVLFEKNPKNKGKSFDETGISLTDKEIQQYDDMLDLLDKKYENKRNDITQKEKDSWTTYLKDYGNYQQKKQAISDEYTEKINKATTEGERAILGEQEKAELEQLDQQYGKSTKAMADLFEDAAHKSAVAIQAIIDKYEALVSYMSGTSGDTSSLSDIGFTDKDIKKIERGEISIKDITDAIKSLKKELKDKSPWQTFKGNINDAFNKIKNPEMLGEGIASIGEAAVDFAPALKQFSSDVAAIFGTEDSAITSVVDGLAGLGTAAAGVGQAMSGDIVGGAMNAVSGIAKVAGAFEGLFGADYSQYNKMRDEYDALVSVWDDIIGKKKQYVDISYGDEARKTAAEIESLTKKNEASLRALGIERLNSGASIGSHSIGVRIKNGMSDQGWKELMQAANNAGVSYSSITAGRMEKLFSLSSEQLEKLKEDAPTFWAKLDDDVRTYLDKIIDCNDELKDMKDNINETFTGVTFDAFYDSFVDALTDMDKSSEDFADDFGEYLKKAMLSNLIANKYKNQIENLYNTWANKSDSDSDGIYDLTQSEAEELRKAQKELADEMLKERDALASTFGWESDSSQSATSGGFQTMSQDSADELNGRFTALQITGEEMKKALVETLTKMGEITMLTTDGNIALSNILNQHVITNTYLEDIVRYTKPILGFTDKLDKIINKMDTL